MSRPTVRAVSYNLLHGIDLRTGPAVDLAGAADVLATLDAQIVALQEVDRGQERSGGVDQVAHLARELGMQGVFCAALRGSPDEAWEPATSDEEPAYGVGLLVRGSILSTRRIRLPGGGAGRRSGTTSPLRPGWDGEPRVALAADVRVGDIDLRVVVTHLSYLPGRAIRQLRTAVRATTDGAARPAALIGDLNLPAWMVRGVAAPLRHGGGQATFPAWRPRLQMHHVLVDDRLDVVQATAHPQSSSDHRPLVVVVRPRP